MNISFELGKYIRKLRNLKGMTQQQLAEKANISISFLGVIERGQKSPTIDTLKSIATALDITLSELMSFDNKEPSSDSEKVQALLIEYTDKIENIYKNKKIL